MAIRLPVEGPLKKAYTTNEPIVLGEEVANAVLANPASLVLDGNTIKFPYKTDTGEVRSIDIDLSGITISGDEDKSTFYCGLTKLATNEKNFNVYSARVLAEANVAGNRRENGTVDMRRIGASDSFSPTTSDGYWYPWFLIESKFPAMFFYGDNPSWRRLTGQTVVINAVNYSLWIRTPLTHREHLSVFFKNFR